MQFTYTQVHFTRHDDSLNLKLNSEFYFNFNVSSASVLLIPNHFILQSYTFPEISHTYHHFHALLNLENIQLCPEKKTSEKTSHH